MNAPLASFPRSRPVSSYFLITFAVSWASALCVAAPQLVHHGALSQLTGILMFPAMLSGPILASIFLTGILEGRNGLGILFAKINLRSASSSWLIALLLPPALVVITLLILEKLVSAAFAPNFFLVGVLFGVPAGFIEEIGWTGFAFPRMRQSGNSLSSAIVLGLLWSLWHLPVVNYLGAAAPHGRFWLPFFLAFAGAMTAMRVLISWTYVNTESLLLAQLMHVSSTSSLVVFGAAHVTAAQEAFWYAIYGAILWIAVLILAMILGKSLKQQSE